MSRNTAVLLLDRLMQAGQRRAIDGYWVRYEIVPNGVDVVIAAQGVDPPRESRRHIPWGLQQRAALDPLDYCAREFVGVTKNAEGFF